MNIPNAARRNSFHWIKDGVGPLLDHGLFSVANFLLAIGLARAAPPLEYGHFSFAYALLLLAVSLHAGLVTEPLLVLGNERFAARREEYFAAVLLGHGFLACSITLALAGVAAVLSLMESPLAPATWAMTVAAPLTLTTWLARRFCYVTLQTMRAAVLSGAYLVSIVACGVVMMRLGFISATAAFGVLGVAALGPLAWLLGRVSIVRFRMNSRLIRETWREHWRLGSWTLGSFVFRWIPRNMPFVVLPLTAGAEANAIVMAAINVFAPPLQANIALSTALVPAYIESREKGVRGLFVRRSLALVVLPSTVWWVAAIAGGQRAIDWLYRGRYPDIMRTVELIGALPVLTGIATVLGAILYAERRQRDLFVSFLGGSIASLSLGTTATVYRGAFGASAGMVVAYVVIVILMVGATRHVGPWSTRSVYSDSGEI